MIQLPPMSKRERDIRWLVSEKRRPFCKTNAEMMVVDLSLTLSERSLAHRK